MYRRALGLVALLALVFAVGCGKKKSEAPKGPGGTSTAAGTPEEAFKQFQKAAADKDLKGMAALMTPELVDKTFEKVFGMVLLSVGFMEALGGEEGKKAAKAVFASIEKHGITKDDIEKVTKDKKPDALKELTAKVKDKPGLMGELMDTLQKAGKQDEKAKKRDAEEREATLASTLKDVKVQGDTATATLVHKKLDRKTKKREEKEDPIKFKKVDGNWRIDEFPMD